MDTLASASLMNFARPRTPDFGNMFEFEQVIKPRNVRVLDTILSSPDKEVISMIREMYGANLVSIDDIYRAVSDNSGRRITEDIVDLLIEENKMDHNLCVQILKGLAYNEHMNPDLLESNKIIFDKIRSFIDKDIELNILFTFPLYAAEELCDIDSVELNETFFDCLKHANRDLSEKFIRILLDKRLDDVRHLCVLGVHIIRFNIDLIFYNRNNTSDIDYLNEFMESTATHPMNIVIYFSLLAFIKSHNRDYLCKQMNQIVVDTIDANNLLDNEAAYDYISFYSNILCSKSSDRMKKYHFYLDTYVSLFINSNKIFHEQNQAYKRELWIDRESDKIASNIIKILQRCHETDFGKNTIESDHIYTMTAELFVEKLCTNWSGDVSEGNAIVTNLLDLMESDVAFNQWIISTY